MIDSMVTHAWMPADTRRISLGSPSVISTGICPSGDPNDLLGLDQPHTYPTMEPTI